MAPKKSKASKASLKKVGTMAATAAIGQEFLKKTWGEDKLNQVNAMLSARDKSDSDTDDEAPTSSTTAKTTASASKSKSKPTLSKARTMKSTASEGKALIGTQALGDTRSETKRRQAAVKAKEALQEVSKSTGGRKPGLKRLGTMANTAREGKAYVKRVGGNKKGAAGGKRAAGRGKKSTK